MHKVLPVSSHRTFVVNGCTHLGHRVVVATKFCTVAPNIDRLCGLVVRVSGYRYRGPGFDPRRYQIF